MTTGGCRATVVYEAHKVMTFLRVHSSNGRDDLSFFRAGGTHWYVVSAASASAYRPCLQIKLWTRRTSVRVVAQPRSVEEQGERARGSTARLPDAQL